MLRLPGASFVTIELVHDPVRGAVAIRTGINHLVVQVDSLDAIVADLAAQGIATEPPGPPGRADEPRTRWLTDPDGYRIELVQWPAGHADGITEADFLSRRAHSTRGSPLMVQPSSSRPQVKRSIRDRTQPPVGLRLMRYG